MNTNPPQKPTTPIKPSPVGNLQNNEQWLSGNLTYEIASAYVQTQEAHIKYMYKTATGEEMVVDQEMMKSIYAFANSFAETLAPKMAEVIHKYIKNMEITMNPNGLLVTSMGPVTGSVSTKTKNFIIK